MPDQSQIINSTMEDLQNYQSFVVGNTVPGMRAELDHITRRLVILNRRLIELMNNEAIIKARIINNTALLQVQDNFKADSPKDPKQSMKNTPATPQPDQNLSFDKYKIANITIGIKALDAELNKVNFEIQGIQQKIKFYENEQTTIQNQLTAATQNQPSNFIDKTHGRVISPQSSDLEQDRIAKSRIGNVMLLYQLCKTYQNYTLDPNTGKSKYPDEPKLARNLMNMQQTFVAVAKGFPDGEFTEGPTILDLEFPGSINNEAVLLIKLGPERATAKSHKLNVDINRYISDLTALSQDTFSSDGIQKKPNAQLPENDSMRSQTENYPASVLRLGKNYVWSFELPSIASAVTKVWKRENGQLFQDLPTCPNVILSPTSSDDKLLAYRKQQSADQAAAATNYKETKEAQAAADAKSNLNLVNQLPGNEPAWVTKYVAVFGNSTNGNVVVNENDENVSVYVFRAWSVVQDSNSR
jgi:hypothetical protein